MNSLVEKYLFVQIAGTTKKIIKKFNQENNAIIDNYHTVIIYYEIV